MTIISNKYQNIIFDLGGVVLNIDPLLTAKAFSDLGLSNSNELFSPSKQKQLFDLYEKGEISSDGFRNQFKYHCSDKIDDAAVDRAWNAMLLDLPKERLLLLQKAKALHRTFLLSNTNDIHIETFNVYLEKNFGIPDLSGCFEKMYLSYKVGMRKPDAEIFELVLSENNLYPNETLFIDDSIENV